MQVKINDVSVSWSGAGAKKYGKAVVKFTNDRGEDRSQTLVSFKNPEVFKKVQELVGQDVDVTSQKNGDFWEWVSITAISAAAGPSVSPANTATRVSGSNYETREERAARQVLIVKQSSLSAAVATLTPGAKAALDPKAVLALAQDYADWVFDTESSNEMDDDIPF